MLELNYIGYLTEFDTGYIEYEFLWITNIEANAWKGPKHHFIPPWMYKWLGSYSTVHKTSIHLSEAEIINKYQVLLFRL